MFCGRQDRLETSDTCLEAAWAKKTATPTWSLHADELDFDLGFVLRLDHCVDENSVQVAGLVCAGSSMIEDDSPAR